MLIYEKYCWREVRMLYHDMWGNVSEVKPHEASKEEAEAYQNFLPEHQEYAHKLMKRFLGYVPFEASYYAHEISIRKVINGLPDKTAINEAGVDEVYKIGTLVRNDDMERDKWTRPVTLDENDLRCYNETHFQYIRAARDRLAGFIGYYPELKYSFPSEIYIRSMMLDYDLVNFDEPTSSDIRAITALHYREDFFMKGKKEADKSPLPGLCYTGKTKNKNKRDAPIFQKKYN